MRIIKSETRTLYVLAVEDAEPMVRRTGTTNVVHYLPQKVEVLVIAKPDHPERLGPAEVHGPLLTAKGAVRKQWAHERHWPMDWTKAPEVVQHALRELGLAHLANLPEG